MQLTMQTDYALRVLIYLATRSERLVSTAAIAEAYVISREHVAKVAKRLVKEGYLRAQRGVGGGLALARAPDQIVVGEIVRRYEPHFDLVPCFVRRTDGCAISPACALKAALFEARAAFFGVLDAKTLADLTHNGTDLQYLLGRPTRGEREGARPVARAASSGPCGRRFPARPA